MAQLSETSLSGSTNLKGHWKLDANSNDFSGSGPNGSDTDVSYVEAKYSNGASFNGSSSKIEFAQDADLEFGTGAFSVAAWVKPTALTNSTDFIGKTTAGEAYVLLR